MQIIIVHWANTDFLSSAFWYMHDHTDRCGDKYTFLRFNPKMHCSRCPCNVFCLDRMRLDGSDLINLEKGKIG